MIGVRAFLADLEEILSKKWGEKIEIMRYEEIAKRKSTVARIYFPEHETIPQSLVVRHIPLEKYPAKVSEDWHSKFRNDYIAYTLFSKANTPLECCPKCLITDTRGVIIMEDIGTQSETLQLDKGVIQKIAVSLANLHCATTEGYQDFEKTKKEYGFVNSIPQYEYAYTEEDNVDCVYRERFHLGVQEIERWCSLFGVKLGEFFTETIKKIETKIKNPGQFLSYIHDNITDKKHVLLNEEKAFFIDFNKGVFAHSLLDLAQILVGKFERNKKENVFFLNNPVFPLEIIKEYRKAYESKREIQFEDAFWQEELSGALIYRTLIQIGRLRKITDGNCELKGTIQQHLQAILQNLEILLKENDSHQNVVDVFKQLTQQAQV